MELAGLVNPAPVSGQLPASTSSEICFTHIVYSNRKLTQLIGKHVNPKPAYHNAVRSGLRHPEKQRDLVLEAHAGSRGINKLTTNQSEQFIKLTRQLAHSTMLNSSQNSTESSAFHGLSTL